jgi:hypothetical protein
MCVSLVLGEVVDSCLIHTRDFKMFDFYSRRARGFTAFEVEFLVLGFIEPDVALNVDSHLRSYPREPAR